MPAEIVEGEKRGPRLAHALGVQDAGRVLRDFATYLPTQAIPAIAGFLVLPILARKLAPTELGVLAISQTLVTFGWTASGSWLILSIVREYPVSRQRDEVARFALTLRRATAWFGLFFLAFVLLLAASTSVSSAVSENLFLIAAATLGLSVQNIAVSLFAASLRPRAYAIVEVLARTGGIALGVALVFNGHNVQGYLLGLALASLCVGLVGLAAAWPRPSSTNVERSHVVDWLGYGVPAGLAGLTLWGLFFADRYLLAALEDTGAVGVYTVGNVIGDKSVSIPVLAFFTAASPLLVTAYEQRGRAEVERLMRAYTRVILLICVPIVAYLNATSGILVPLLAGTTYYYDAVPVVPVVAAGTLFYALALVGTTGLIVAKRTKPLVLAAGFALAVNIVANLVLIPPFGIMGAAVATPIGMLAYLAATATLSRRHTHWRFPFATAARAVVAGVIAWRVSIPAMQALESGPAQFGVGAVVGGLTYLAILCLLGERSAS